MEVFIVDGVAVGEPGAMVGIREGAATEDAYRLGHLSNVGLVKRTVSTLNATVALLS